MSSKDKEELGDLIEAGGGSSGGGEGEFLKPSVFIPLTCASLIALVCGTTNAMASSGLADDITEYFNQGRSSTDLVITSTHEQTLISVGLIGLFLTIFAGIVNDYFGSYKLAYFSVPLIAPCYFAMSFVQSAEYVALLYVLNCAIGFASGAGFLAALTIGLRSVESNPGTGVAITGAFLSISLLFTNLLGTVNRHITDCVGPECWISYVRTIAVTAVIIQWPSLLGLFFVERYKKKKEGENVGLLENTNTIQTIEQKEAEKPVSLIASVRILTNFFFWTLIVGYFIGISSGLITITQSNMWKSYVNPHSASASWSSYIGDAFSAMNCTANFFSGWICDRLLAKYKFPRQRFTAVILSFTSLLYLGMGILYTSTSWTLHQEDTPSQGLQVLFAIMMASTGLCFGSFLTLYPTMVGEFYGPQNFGIYFGYAQIGPTIASFLTPIGASKIYESVQPNSYSTVLWVVAILNALAAVAHFFKKYTPVNQWW